MSASKRRYMKELCEQIADLKDGRDIENFLRALLTPKEQEEIPRRLQIVKLLQAGKPQREIAEKLGVGIATVTRGAREVKDGKFDSL